MNVSVLQQKFMGTEASILYNFLFIFSHLNIYKLYLTMSYAEIAR